MMRKDTKMNARVTKNGYKYYTPQRSTRRTQPPKENKWKKGLKRFGQVLLTGMKNLPGLLMKAAVLMVTTPLMIVLFIFNLLKSLLVTAIGWFVFKVIVALIVACYWSFFTKNGVAPASVDTWFSNWTFPHGVPIYYWWEITIIVVLAVITALSLTFHPNEE